MTDKDLDRKFIDFFTFIVNIVKKGDTISCDEITNEEYWNDEWTECPVCGCKPDKDGLWLHKEHVIN